MECSGQHTNVLRLLVNLLLPSSDSAKDERDAGISKFVTPERPRILAMCLLSQHHTEKQY